VNFTANWTLRGAPVPALTEPEPLLSVLVMAPKFALFAVQQLAFGFTAVLNRTGLSGVVLKAGAFGEGVTAFSGGGLLF